MCLLWCLSVSCTSSIRDWGVDRTRSSRTERGWGGKGDRFTLLHYFTSPALSPYHTIMCCYWHPVCSSLATPLPSTDPSPTSVSCWSLTALSAMSPHRVGHLSGGACGVHACPVSSLARPLPLGSGGWLMLVAWPFLFQLTPTACYTYPFVTFWVLCLWIIY